MYNNYKQVIMMEPKKEKEEYVYLMIVSIQDKMGNNIDYDAIPFKTAKDVKKAILNIIANSIKNSRDAIRCISYDGREQPNKLFYARINYDSYNSKTYRCICRKIHEVK